MDKIYKAMKKEGGDIGEKSSKGESSLPNAYWINNPFDHKRKVDTIDDHMKIDIPNSKKNESIKRFENFEEERYLSDEEIEDSYSDYQIRELKFDSDNTGFVDIVFPKGEDMVNNFIIYSDGKIAFDYWLPEKVYLEICNEITKEKKVNESTAGSETYNKIMRGMNTIANWNSFNNQQNLRERPVNVGQQVDQGKNRGYINRVVGDEVYIDSIEPRESTIKGTDIPIKIKKFTQLYKKNEQEKTGDLALQGPSNLSKTKAPKDGKNTVATKLDDKSKKAKDQKIVNKINQENDKLKLKDAAPYGKVVIERFTSFEVD